MLAEELERARKYAGKSCPIDLHKVKMGDVQTIFHTMEPRNLKAAYRFYVGGDFENAHAAEADTLATYEVLKGELDRYPETLKNDVDFLASFTERQKIVDYAGRLVYNEKKEVVISFGKHKGKTAREVYFSEPSYFAWIENGDFTLDTKRQFSLLKEQFEAEKKAESQRKNTPLSEAEMEDVFAKLQGKFGQGNLF